MDLSSIQSNVKGLKQHVMKNKLFYSSLFKINCQLKIETILLTKIQ